MDPLIARSFEIHKLSRRSFDHQFTFRKGDSWVYTGTVCVQINRGLLRILFSGQFHFQILLRTFFSSPLTRESFGWWRTHGPEPSIHPSSLLCNFESILESSIFKRIPFEFCFPGEVFLRIKIENYSREFYFQVLLSLLVPRVLWVVAYPGPNIHLFSYVKVEFSRVLFPNVLISSVHSNFVLRVEDYLHKN